MCFQTRKAGTLASFCRKDASFKSDGWCSNLKHNSRWQWTFVTVKTHQTRLDNQRFPQWSKTKSIEMKSQSTSSFAVSESACLRLVKERKSCLHNHKQWEDTFWSSLVFCKGWAPNIRTKSQRCLTAKAKQANKASWPHHVFTKWRGNNKFDTRSTCADLCLMLSHKAAKWWFTC